ncbi:hypothetical protein CWC38_02265 [Kocuria tytonicola]|nr:hypothetical protein CWC38_02265 [Kocuria tytonicola]
MMRVLKWVTPVVVVVHAVLVATGVLDLGSAVRIALTIEVVLLLATIVLAMAAAGTYRQQRREGATKGAALAAAAREALPGPVVAIMRHEFHVLRALWLALRHRDDTPTGAATFSYGASQGPIFYTLTAVSLVEIGVVHWLVPWAWARLLLGFLGLYGAVWLIGFYQTFRRRPHYVHEGRLVLRCGLLGEITIATKDVVDAHEKFLSWRTRSFAIHQEADRAPAVSLTPSGMTDVTLQLTEGSVVHAKHRMLIAPTIHVGCDHPADLVQYLRTHKAESATERPITS